MQGTYKRACSGDSFYAIELINGGKVIGHLYFNQIDSPEILTWESGYITNPIYQRKGYTSEASEALIEYAMTKLGIYRIVAECNPDNITSWKLLKKNRYVTGRSSDKKHIFPKRFKWKSYMAGYIFVCYNQAIDNSSQ